MNLGIKGKKALVFGGSAGIGKAIAAELVKEGVDICIASRSNEKLDLALKELKSLQGLQKIIKHDCDMSSKEQIQKTIDYCLLEFGQIDILINNQGGPMAGSFEKIDEEQLFEALQTNLLSFFRSIKGCLPNMKKNKWGRIVNILSVSAKEPIPNMLLSNMIRPAILGMTKTISAEIAKDKITINNVLPSAVLTDRSRTLVQERANKENRPIDDVLKDIAATLPSQYLASPEELAQIATFLCGQGASYINGSTISVDGASSKTLF